MEGGHALIYTDRLITTPSSLRVYDTNSGISLRDTLMSRVENTLMYAYLQHIFYAISLVFNCIFLVLIKIINT